MRVSTIFYSCGKDSRMDRRTDEPTNPLIQIRVHNQKHWPNQLIQIKGTDYFMSITATNLIVFLSQTHMPQSAAGKAAKAGRDVGLKQNKAGHTATHVACG